MGRVSPPLEILGATHRNKRTRTRGLLFSQRISSRGMERQDGGNRAAKSSSLISVANSLTNVCKRSCLPQNLEVHCFHAHAQYFCLELNYATRNRENKSLRSLKEPFVMKPTSLQFLNLLHKRSRVCSDYTLQLDSRI